MTILQKIVAVALIGIVALAAVKLLAVPDVRNEAEVLRFGVCEYLRLDWLRCPESATEAPAEPGEAPTSPPGVTTVQSTPAPEPSAPSPAQTPAESESPGPAVKTTSAQVPARRELVARLKILGRDQKGVRLTIPADAWYEVVYEGGAYSVNKDAGQPSWTTSVRGYVGTRVRWVGLDQAPPDVQVFNNSWLPSRAEAEAAAAGAVETYDFTAGQVITLVAMDRKGFFSDNPGAVTISIWRLPDEVQ